MAFAALIPLIGSLIGAGGSIAAGALSRPDSPSRRKPELLTVPLQPYENVIRQYLSRLLALNATAVPPSFGEYVQSGGKAKFPISDPGLSPTEMMQLGLIDKFGNARVRVPIGQQGLNPDQKLFYAFQKFQRENVGKKDANALGTRLLQELFPGAAPGNLVSDASLTNAKKIQPSFYQDPLAKAYARLVKARQLEDKGQAGRASRVRARGEETLNMTNSLERARRRI